MRPRLFGIAYRMLGRAAEAEDIVQDVWVRWQTTDRSVVRDTRAFLATTTTRLAINAIKSARSRRETYMGPSLPEPVDTSADPALGAERSEALEFAVLLLLEKLSPTERAAYVLREAFDYSYREIANILRLEEANTRQLVTRVGPKLSAFGVAATVVGLIGIAPGTIIETFVAPVIGHHAMEELESGGLGTVGRLEIDNRSFSGVDPAHQVDAPDDVHAVA